VTKLTPFKGLIAVLATATLLSAAPNAYALQESSTSEDAQPWYEAFTFATEDNALSGVALDVTETEIEWNTGERWGFTLGLDSDPSTQVEFDSISAGAFVDVGSRFRFRGAVRLTTPSELYIGSPDSERAPEVKFESALRF